MSLTRASCIHAALLLAEETARSGLPPEEPGVVRLVSGLGWRLDRALATRRAARMADQVGRTFRVNAATVANIVREAHDVGLQARLESLLLPRMDEAQLDRYLQVQPRIRTLHGPAWVVYPHAGNLLLLATALARRAEGLVVFEARQGPPSCAMEARRRRRREEEEARLGITREHDPEALPRWFEAGRVVAASFDDRAWGRFEQVPFLGRPALLAAWPWAVCERMGVPVIPAVIRRERDKVNRLKIGAPRPADLVPYLWSEVEPHLRANAGHYAAFLAECRDGVEEGRAPLFTDDVPEQAWRPWLTRTPRTD